RPRAVRRAGRGTALDGPGGAARRVRGADSRLAPGPARPARPGRHRRDVPDPDPHLARPGTLARHPGHRARRRHPRHEPGGRGPRPHPPPPPPPPPPRARPPPPPPPPPP